MVSISDIQAARELISPYVHLTPLATSRQLDGISRAHLWFKCENLQKVGAFKARGACNAVLGLSEGVAARGVVTHSSGNHGAALAYAAAIRGIPSWVVMPSNASRVKKKAVASYGAEIVECGPGISDRETACREVEERTGAHRVPPYDDERIIAGQGTAALEMFEQLESTPLDALVCPVGGGGLVAGCSIVARTISPGTAVIAAEPQGANDAEIGFRSRERVTSFVPNTMADGLRTVLGEITFPIILDNVDEVVAVSEESIVAAMRLVWERMKLVIEPSSAVAVAAVLNRTDIFAGKSVGIVLSGGNVDLDLLPWK